MNTTLIQNPEDYVFAPLLTPGDPDTSEYFQMLCRGLGHKMNNHLSVVHGYSSLLLMDENTAPGVDEAARCIRDASDRMQHLLGDLQVVAGCAPINCGPINVDDWLGEHERAIRDRAAAAQVPFTFHVAGPLPAVYTDLVRLRDMVFHLLDNALEAAAGHQGQVAFDVLPPGIASDGDAPGVDFLIRNSGMILQHQHIARYMKPFETTKNHGAHPGLGLPVASTLAQACGGFLGLRTYGSTTTAWLHLKVATP